MKPTVTLDNLHEQHSAVLLGLRFNLDFKNKNGDLVDKIDEILVARGLDPLEGIRQLKECK